MGDEIRVLVLKNAEAQTDAGWILKSWGMRRAEAAAPQTPDTQNPGCRVWEGFRRCWQQHRGVRARPSRPLGEARPAVCKLAPPRSFFTRDESALARGRQDV